MSSVLHCKQLSKSYQQGEIETHVLDGLDLTVEKGEYSLLWEAQGVVKVLFFTSCWCLRFTYFR